MAISGHLNHIPAFLEKPYRETLIDNIVFGNQDGKRGPVFAQGVPGNQQWFGGLRLATQGDQYGIKKFRLFEGLKEIGQDSELAAAGGIPLFPPELSIMIVVEISFGCCRMLSATEKPSMPGI